VALLDEKGRTLLLGLAVGAAAIIIGREFFTPLRRVGRPLAKEAVKSGMAVLEHGRERLALMTEQVADLVAEAVAEREQSPARTKK
jgi:ABC-type transport system involved in cytochrome bd biosynthesis fused ATPase/permease subunit